MFSKKTFAGLGKGEFKLFLQPQHDVHACRIVGAESLSRFITDDGAVVMPSRYIDEFEKSGSIKEFDFYMLEQVCIFLSQWNTRFENGEAMIPVSVNFSKTTLESDGFLKRLEDVVNKYQVKPKLIEIEITELHRFRSYDKAVEVIEKLRQKGCLVSIDDYGKNSSAFSLIRRVDVDILKIDREITGECEHKLKTYLIFETVVQLAKKLGVSVVAEGIETKEQFDIAKNIGCDIIQGWYFFKALSVDDFVEYVKSHTACKS